MKKLIYSLFRKGATKTITPPTPKGDRHFPAVATKKEGALKMVGERYGRAITRLSDT